jgi:bifunctional DNA-binding transcriptional regulator/antitoxin component of YhaV-PrlF toxin-antitoxin module
MKATITISGRGVITLPSKLRSALQLKTDDQLIAEVTPRGLLLRPAITLPIEMYTPARTREFDHSEADLARLLAREGSARRHTRRG